MRNSLDRICRVNQNTFYVQYPPSPSENRTVYEIMLKKVVEVDRQQRTIRCMRSACWLNEDTNTESEYVILIVFPRPQWLHGRASLVPDSSFACVVFFL